MKNKREKFEIVGSVTVDAGLIQIGDPCYQFEDHDLWLKYLEDSGLSKGGDVTVIAHDTSKGGNYDDCAKAVAVSSGFGDGIYNVLVKKCSETGRVKELKIKFF